jgi:hypothetical protein
VVKRDLFRVTRGRGIDIVISFGEPAMKTASLITAAALFFAWIPAQAQKPPAAQPAEKKAVAAPTAKEPAKPAAETKAATKPAASEAKPAETKSEMKPAASEPAKPMATAARKSRAAEDARECLQQSTNRDIIKCAERFL